MIAHASDNSFENGNRRDDSRRNRFIWLKRSIFGEFIAGGNGWRTWLL